MERKSDGRMYSRITRRSVAIVGQIQRGREYSINEIAAAIEAKELPEFFLERFGKQMSLPRIRDYVRYLVDLEVLSPTDNKYILALEHKHTDEDWAQALSDLALLHLAGILRRTAAETIEYFKALLEHLFDERRLPTIEALLTEVDISGGRSEEVFKWSLYVFTDVDNCPFDIRRYPVLVRRGE
ncbi:MAG TPA: hypothetical protein VM537_26505 [Anaerolineae bacterium]|nr:hypothetical protein [Anaerolineae bacterium]